jgi:hypothetical protein
VNQSLSVVDILEFGFLGSMLPIFIHKTIRMALDFGTFRNWRQVEATLDKLDIEKPTARSSFATDNRNVKVRFSYQYGNAQFQGSSVAVPDLGPFPLLQYSPATYRPLEEIFQSTKRIHAWVDPDRPERAVLMKVSIRPYVLGMLAMAACFAGLSYFVGMMGWSESDLLKIGVAALGIYLILLYWMNWLKQRPF